ncbi:MAG: type IV secretion system DNA-binding domain-containing protein [Proteobacteria bacterium]|nr:type IV secretion system DNA-binding domain-containing protein [Pseudomonadota bacterium]
MTGPFETLAALRGTASLVAAFAAVQLPMLAGLVRSRASLGRVLKSPILAAPLTVAAGVAIGLAVPFLQGLGLTSDAARAAFGLGTFVFAGYAAGRWVGMAEARAAAGPGTVPRRGAAVSEVIPQPARGAAAWRSHAFSPGRSSSRGRGSGSAGIVTLAGVPLDAADETRHFKLIGTTGTGKSTGIRELLEGALRRGDRAVIADPDGGYLRSFHDARRGDVILNPFEAGSVRWDLFGEIRAPYDVQQLARALVPEHDGAERSWREYARTFLGAVISQAHAAGTRDVKDLYRLLVVADTGELRTLLEGTPAQPFLEEHNGRMFDSIRSVTSSAVGALDHIARQEGGPNFSVRDWVSGTRDRHAADRGQGGVLFMPYRAGQIPALKSVISAWMRLAIFEAMNRDEGDQRLWFVVDELDALGQIDGLKDALARLRKFGGRCVLGLQSIAQVSGTYGNAEAQTIVENCANTLILRCSGSERGGTSRFASSLIGERQVVHMTRSLSRRPGELRASMTQSEHLSIEPAVLGAQIEQLPDLQGYLKLASDPVWRRVQLAAPRAQEVQPANARWRPRWRRGADRSLPPTPSAGLDGYGRE